MAATQVTETEACALLAERLGPLPEGHRVVASKCEGSGLWNVNAIDDRGWPYAGANFKVGPDGRLWTFSSNPGIHDFDLVVAALNAVYSEGLQSRVENDRLAELIRSETAKRTGWRRKVVDAAAAGDLRERPERRLP